MSEVMIITDGGVEYVDRDSLSASDKLTVDTYLDAVEYLLNPQDHPDRISAFTVEDFRYEVEDERLVEKPVMTSAFNEDGELVTRPLLDDDGNPVTRTVTETFTMLEGMQVGGYPLEFRPEVLLAMAHAGELDDVGESHSL